MYIKHMIPQEKRDAIIDLYNSNLSISAISKMSKVSATSISKILKQSGIIIRKDNYQKLNIDSVEVNAMYNNGQSTYDIAKHFKCSDETIRNMIVDIRNITERNERSEDSILKIRKASIDNWNNDEYKAKVHAATNTVEYKAKLQKAGIINYAESLGKWMQTLESKTTISQKIKEKWKELAYLEKQKIWFAQRGAMLTAASVEALKDPVKRKQWIEKLRVISSDNRVDGGWVSTSQKQLYYILESSKIVFHEEGDNTKVGPFYMVDCVIPKQQNMIKPLIIEVQGEYWHSLQHVITKDKQKATYIRNHTDYDLLCLDELHLNSFDEVQQKLLSFGLSIYKFMCTPKELSIKQITETEAKMFYSIFHYSSTVRKGAITYGAFLNDELMAVISYCRPLRIETATRLGYALSEVFEISRLARRTNLVCKNMASYLITKTKKLLNARCIISFSDSTYGHTGGVYKASGFINDGLIGQDYHYISLRGKYHKKTIWDRAKRMKMGENEYADKHGLIKIFGKEKTRWVLHIK